MTLHLKQLIFKVTNTQTGAFGERHMAVIIICPHTEKAASLC